MHGPGFNYPSFVTGRKKGESKISGCPSLGTLLYIMPGVTQTSKHTIDDEWSRP